MLSLKQFLNEGPQEKQMSQNDVPGSGNSLGEAESGVPEYKFLKHGPKELSINAIEKCFQRMERTDVPVEEQLKFCLGVLKQVLVWLKMPEKK